jgi:hypothetical protein
MAFNREQTLTRSLTVEEVHVYRGSVKANRICSNASFSGQELLQEDRR